MLNKFLYTYIARFYLSDKKTEVLVKVVLKRFLKNCRLYTKENCSESVNTLACLDLVKK